MPVVATARRLRKAMSPPEARLWVVLRRLRTQGYHFRRQHPLFGYYLDFVCLDRRLIIEVDGAGHDEERDRRRDAVTASAGFRTMRFDNASIRDNLEGVLEGILAVLEAAAPTRPLRGHPPRGGEGE
ncbi:endonuclease domain-containing protein [Brevundimonas sp. NPDC092305]|uniref:endonuclease domain-containing protein n=1 Tax=Brevundimonas sp. NPDC092305 TaxID=3363957 RepID=UPI0038173495